MNSSDFYLLLWSWTGFGALVFLVLLFVSAPYGRHSKKNWGPMIPNRVGWVVMELPSLLVFTLTVSGALLQGPSPVWLFAAAYMLHYINRSLIYPFRTRTRGKQMPAVIAAMAVVFNLANGWFNGNYFSRISEGYEWTWLTDPRFIAGAMLFAAGASVNLRTDRKLLRLRGHSGEGYQVPRGGLFEYVSCPNFFGELVQWTGFAVLTWSPAALVFAAWTFFNLLPRALDHHRWYRRTFPDYPAGRKAMIPFLV